MILLLLLAFNVALSFPILWCGAVTSNSISFRALGYSGHSFRLSLLPGLEFPGYQQRITVDIAEIYVCTDGERLIDPKLFVVLLCFSG